MTSQELALLALLPDKWQKIILGYEANEWLKNRRVAASLRRSFSEGGGHISLRQEVVDKNHLHESLRSAVARLEDHYNEQLLSELPLPLAEPTRERAIRVLNEIGIETVEDWLDYGHERLLKTDLGKKSMNRIEDSVKSFTASLVLSGVVGGII